MAAYQFLGSESTIQVLSPDIVRDAQRVTALAAESQIVYSLLFAPYPTDPQGAIIWTPELIASELDKWAGYWNTNAKVPGVRAIGISQDVDELGQLRDVALVVVSSTSGASTTQVTLRPHDFFPDTFAPRIAAVRAQLDATEPAGSGIGESA